MHNLFSPDSKFIHYTNKFSDLVTLNLWLVLTCLPVFTVGASVTAMHVVLLKIYRDELDQGVTKCFFQAFKSNFRQASIIWGIYAALSVVLITDFYWINASTFPWILALKIILIIICTLMLLSMNWVFVLQSRYSNTVLATIRNALIFSAIHFVDSALMLVMLALPIVLLLWQPSTVPFILICGFTLSGITRAAFYNRIFIKYESVSKTNDTNQKH